MKFALITFLTALVTGMAAAAPTVSDLAAIVRPGQVFLRWTETAVPAGDLRVYMSAEPITRDNLAAATLLSDRVEPSSATDWIEDPAACKGGSINRGWILEAGAEAVATSGGLFVHTVGDDDPEAAYFAVLAGDGDELTPGNSLAEPVKLQPGMPEAIWQGGNEADRSSAPGKPLILRLHAKTGRPRALNYLAFGDADLGWREGLPFKFDVDVTDAAVFVEPFDRTWINRRLEESWDKRDSEFLMPETMWYGTSDKVFDAELKKTGTPTNYTERRVMWILDWVQETYQTDPNRVYAFGSSMGTGSLHIAMHYPDRFASVDVHVPFVDGGYSQGSEGNAKRYEPMCGPVELICNEGMSLRDRLNLVKFAAETSRDLPFVRFCAGRNDTSVGWRRKPPFIRAMSAQKHGLLACWNDGSHGTAGNMLPDGFPRHCDYQWYLQRFALNLSYPVFTACSADDDPGDGEKDNGDISGAVNLGLNWKDIIDEENRYEVTVMQTLAGADLPITVDVTPRRRQQFRPAPGTQVSASNLDPDGAEVQREVLTVDDAGRVTFPQLRITSPLGNRMALRVD